MTCTNACSGHWGPLPHPFPRALDTTPCPGASPLPLAHSRALVPSSFLLLTPRQPCMCFDRRPHHHGRSATRSPGYLSHPRGLQRPPVASPLFSSPSHRALGAPALSYGRCATARFPSANSCLWPFPGISSALNTFSGVHEAVAILILAGGSLTGAAPPVPFGRCAGPWWRRYSLQAVWSAPDPTIGRGVSHRSPCTHWPTPSRRRAPAASGEEALPRPLS